MVVVGGGTYLESLSASSGCSNVTIPAGGSDNVLVCINGNTGTAGPVSVGVPVVFTSKAVPGSGLPDTYGPTSGRTNLQTQTVNCTGTVWDHGVASVGGADCTVLHVDSAGGTDSIVINLIGGQGDTVTQAWNIYNLMQTDGYTGKLDLTNILATGDVGAMVPACRPSSSRTWPPARPTRTRRAWIRALWEPTPSRTRSV